MVSVRLPEDLENKLNHLCNITKRSKSFYIKDALDNYIQEMIEDMQDIEDAEIALKRIKNKKMKFYTTEEILKML
jgi:RHH-type rel operon transcriptional repressor/antitoxin RelB